MAKLHGTRSIVATPTPGRLVTPSRPRAGLGPPCPPRGLVGGEGLAEPDCSPGPGRRRAGPLASARLRGRLRQGGGRRFLSQHLISGARRLSASAVSTRGLDVRLVWF